MKLKAKTLLWIAFTIGSDSSIGAWRASFSFQVQGIILSKMPDAVYLESVKSSVL